jgi:glutaminase
LADFLPQFATQNADKFGIAICTVDGQRFSIGDVEDPFSLQAIA